MTHRAATDLAVPWLPAFPYGYDRDREGDRRAKPPGPQRVVRHEPYQNGGSQLGTQQVLCALPGSRHAVQAPPEALLGPAELA